MGDIEGAICDECGNFIPPSGCCSTAHTRVSRIQQLEQQLAAVQATNQRLKVLAGMATHIYSFNVEQMKGWCDHAEGENSMHVGFPVVQARKFIGEYELLLGHNATLIAQRDAAVRVVEAAKQLFPYSVIESGGYVEAIVVDGTKLAELAKALQALADDE